MVVSAFVPLGTVVAGALDTAVVGAATFALAGTPVVGAFAPLGAAVGGAF